MNQKVIEINIQALNRSRSNLGQIIATRSQAIYAILSYLPKTQHLSLQILNKRFYDRVIPELMYKYNSLTEDDANKLFDEKLISRFYNIKSGHYLWNTSMKDAMDSEKKLTNWNDVQIKDLKQLFGMKIEKVLVLLDQYYLIDVQNTVLKIHTMSYSGNIKTVNQVDLKRINQAHYCSGASNLIIRVGGYWIKDKTKGRIQDDKIRYNDRISVLNTLTNQWDVTTYGDLNQSRHNCGACTVGNKYLYIFGGSFYRDVKNGKTFSANSIERQNLLNPTVKAEVLLVNVSFPISYTPFAMHYKDDQFLLFGKIYDEKHTSSHKAEIYMVDLAKKSIWNKKYLTKEPANTQPIGKSSKGLTIEKANLEASYDAEIQQVIRTKNKLLLVSNYGIIQINDPTSYKSFVAKDNYFNKSSFARPNSRPTTAVARKVIKRL